MKYPKLMRAAWRIGWDGEAYTLPCVNGYEELNGIMRRFPDKHKVWVSRSRNGLFIPKLKSWQGNVFVCEGWSDAAALIDMGFRAIARSNCETGAEDIKTLLRRRNEVQRVTVVADNDEVGMRGAKRLARSLYQQVQPGILHIPEQYKDMRQWYKAADPVKQAVVERCELC
jgi:5S rRNA maturation endonuclease (ribonuclease M5)